MYLHHLRFLRLVIDEGTFSRAAAAASVSPSAITQAMQGLESALGFPLFQREGRRKIPTPVALRLARHAQNLELDIEGLRNLASRGGDVDHGGQGRPLRVGMSTGAALTYSALIANQWLQEGTRRGPLRICGGDPSALLEALRREELDFVVTPRPRGAALPEVDEVPLFSSQPAIYARAGHPLTQAETLEHLRKVEWAVVGEQGTPGGMIEEAFRVRKLGSARIRVHCADYAGLVELITQSDLMAVIPHAAIVSRLLRGRLQQINVREGLPRYEVCLYVSTRRKLPVSIREVAEVVRRSASLEASELT